MNKETKTIYAIFFVMLVIGAALVVWRWPDVKTTVLPPVQATTATSDANYTLEIPKLGIVTSLAATGLDANKRLLVPANSQVAAWYQAGPVPGQPGTTIITGHLSTAAGPGIFYNLHKLAIGDEIQIQNSKQELIYRVSRIKSYNQDSSFPWNEVYNAGGVSSLRIITCDGVYSSAAGHFSKNLVVFADLVSD